MKVDKFDLDFASPLASYATFHGFLLTNPTIESIISHENGLDAIISKNKQLTS